MKLLSKWEVQLFRKLLEEQKSIFKTHGYEPRCGLAPGTLGTAV